MIEHVMFNPLLMMISITCSYGYLPTVDACLHKLVNHVTALKISFLQNYLLSAISCSVEPCSKHGLLASTFKVLIGLSLVILLARHERSGYDEDYLGDEHAS